MNDEKKTVEGREPETIKEEPAEPQTEQKAQDAEPETEAQKPSGKKNFFNNPRFKHGGMATALTAGFLVIIILINVVVSLLGDRFPSMNVDMTRDSRNTLSEDATNVVDSVKLDTNIYIMLTEEQAKQNEIYAQVATLASKMAERNPKIKVQYKDLDKDPTFANNSKYANLKIQQGTVLVETERRARALAQTDLYSVETDYQTYSQKQYSKVDGALASAVNQVNSEKLPVVAFDNGHSESTDMTSFQSVLSTNNFDPVSFNLMTDAIPKDAQMIVLGTPTTDYTQEELKKLDTFLNADDAEESRMLLVTFDYQQSNMPNFAAFMEEWGLSVPQQVVLDENTQNLVAQDPRFIKAQVKEADEMKIGAASDYKIIATPTASPVNVLFDNRASVSTYTLLTSYDTSYAVAFDQKTGSQQKLDSKAYTLAAAGQKFRSINSKSYHSSVVAMGSSQMFNSAFLTSSTYDNSKYLVDMAKYGTGTTDSNLGVYVQQVELNAADITSNAFLSTVLGIGVFTLLPLLGLLAAGIVVFLKRRHL